MKKESVCACAHACVLDQRWWLILGCVPCGQSTERVFDDNLLTTMIMNARVFFEGSSSKFAKGIWSIGRALTSPCYSYFVCAEVWSLIRVLFIIFFIIESHLSIFLSCSLTSYSVKKLQLLYAKWRRQQPTALRKDLTRSRSWYTAVRNADELLLHRSM